MDFPAQLRLLVNILGLLTGLGLWFSFLFLARVGPLPHLLPYKCILRNSYTQEKTSEQQRGSGKDICLYSSDASPEPFPPDADSEHLSLLSLCTAPLRVPLTSAVCGDSEVMELLGPQASE